MLSKVCLCRESEQENARMPIPGVEVDVKTEQGATYPTLIDSQGQYDLHLPQPQPPNIHLLFRKDGYEGDQTIVPTDRSFNTDMVKPP